MWVPSGIIFIVVGLALLAAWLGACSATTVIDGALARNQMVVMRGAVVVHVHVQQAAARHVDERVDEPAQMRVAGVETDADGHPGLAQPEHDPFERAGAEPVVVEADVGGVVHGVVFRGRRYDTGDRADYLKAVVQIAADRPDLGPDLRAWLTEYVATLR